MADNGKDQVVNGNSRLTSPSASVDILIPPELNEAPAISPLKGHQLMDNPASNASQSVLEVDKSKSVPSSVSPSPDFVKSRFAVTLCSSAEQSYSTSATTSPSKIETSPPQTPKSVKFPEQFPSTASPPQKSPRKNFSIGESSKTLTPKKPVSDPKKLISPPSPASMTSNQDVELQPMNRSLTSSPTRRQLITDESFDIIDRSDIPLLGDSDGEHLDQPDMRLPRSRVSEQETPTSHGSTVTTTNPTGECKKCVEKTLYIYIAAVVSFVFAFFLGAVTVYTYYQFSGRLHNGVGRGNAAVNLNTQLPKIASALAQTAINAVNENSTSFPESKITLDTTTVDTPDTTDPITTEPMTNEPTTDSASTMTTTFVPETSDEANKKRTTSHGN